MGGEGLGARLARLPAIGLFTSFFSASLFGLCNVIVKGVSDTLYLGGNHQKRIDAGGKCGSVHNRLLQIHWNRTSRLLDPHFQKPSKCLCSDCFCPLIMHFVFLSSWNIHPGSISKGQSIWCWLSSAGVERSPVLGQGLTPWWLSCMGSPTSGSFMSPAPKKGCY